MRKLDRAGRGLERESEKERERERESEGEGEVGRARVIGMRNWRAEIKSLDILSRRSLRRRRQRSQ